MTLFSPGPTNIAEEVRLALLADDVCHREPEFCELLLQTCVDIARVAGGDTDYQATPFFASATGCNEAILSSIRGDLLILVAGRYSKRVAAAASQLGIFHRTLSFDSLTGIDMELVAREALANSYSYMFVVHNETSTGVLAPLCELGAFCREQGIELIVDGVSSVGAHDFSLVRSNIACCSLSINKCIEGVPGVAFVVGRRDFFCSLKGCSRSFYFDLYEQWSTLWERGQPRFTASTQVVAAAQTALKRLLLETVERRTARYRATKLYLEAKLRERGVRLLTLPPEKQSNVITLAYLPGGTNYMDVHQRLKDAGFTIYTDTEIIERGMFSIATMGQISLADVDRFIAALDGALSPRLTGTVPQAYAGVG